MENNRPYVYLRKDPISGDYALEIAVNVNITDGNLINPTLPSQPYGANLQIIIPIIDDIGIKPEPKSYSLPFTATQLINTVTIEIQVGDDNESTPKKKVKGKTTIQTANADVRPLI